MDELKSVMDELKSVMEEHMNQMADLVQKLSAEFRSGMLPAYENLLGFYHAIDWKVSVMVALQVLRAKHCCGRQPYNIVLFYLLYTFFLEPFLIGLVGFHVFLLLLTITSRKHINFQMFLFFLACVRLAEKLHTFLGQHWKSFATQNYFDAHGIFLSTLWSGPLLIISMIILINTLFSLCHLVVRWKRAELRHRAKLAADKKES